MTGRPPNDEASVQQETYSKVVKKKKKYAFPRLVEYGSLAKLTQGGGGTVGDGVGMTMGACL